MEAKYIRWTLTKIRKLKDAEARDAELRVRASVLARRMSPEQIEDMMVNDADLVPLLETVWLYATAKCIKEKETA